ncbi:hypothetical protein VTJ49DRAFT_733 [Mycothermus thermophilus]|uniref:DUF7053 domain-containing protein n=1 Tax=Humicola insolens TaxID=85995 RepID=A0ABR3VE67_HUMIN
MPILTTSTRLTHTTRLPRGTSREKALAMLANHEFFLTCSPHLAKYERISPTDEDAAKQPSPTGPDIPDVVKEKLRSDSSDDKAQQPPQLPEPDRYRVTDLVHAVPAGLWDTHVVSDYEFVDLPDAGGVYVRVRSPMGIVMDTLWEVREVAPEEQEDESGPGLRLRDGGDVNHGWVLEGSPGLVLVAGPDGLASEAVDWSLVLCSTLHSGGDPVKYWKAKNETGSCSQRRQAGGKGMKVLPTSSKL